MTVVSGKEGQGGATSRPIPLEPGDHLDRATFHERYLAMPDHVRAELIGGIVYMPSPVGRRHGLPSAEVLGWLWSYKVATPGVQLLDNTTLLLGDDSEPQPDACLVIDPERGGQTSVSPEGEEYVVGAPELVVEVASSSASIDLHVKKRDYERAGVREYIVVLVREGRVVWFVRRDGVFAEATPGEDGLFRSEVFPGLWLDAAALLRGDAPAVLDALRRGTETPEQAGFAARLAAAGKD